MQDSVKDVYIKYFKVHKIPNQEQERVLRLINFEDSPKRFGATLSKLKNQIDIKSLETSDLVSKLKDAVIVPME